MAHAGPLGDDIFFEPPPRRCPNTECRTDLNMAYPQCPACGEPLSPRLLKARAEAAVKRGLGFPLSEQGSGIRDQTTKEEPS